ncbi:MAG TPA: hypothetical protein VKB50_01840 [Vicinamibacterales bacterium]|nr:hypothetical protein [Vicinamibacterales bacterium]
MSNALSSVDIKHPLGVVGLFLMLIVAVMANHGYTAHRTLTGRIGGFLARRTIDAVAAIGWLIDRLPRPSPRAEA